MIFNLWTLSLPAHGFMKDCLKKKKFLLSAEFQSGSRSLNIRLNTLRIHSVTNLYRSVKVDHYGVSGCCSALMIRDNRVFVSRLVPNGQIFWTEIPNVLKISKILSCITQNRRNHHNFCPVLNYTGSISTFHPSWTILINLNISGPLGYSIQFLPLSNFLCDILNRECANQRFEQKHTYV